MLINLPVRSFIIFVKFVFGFWFLISYHRYALPLFFLGIKTNFGYVIVATFITQDETKSSNQEALKVLKMWNPEWTPKHIMTDNSEAEIFAVEEAFPGIVVLNDIGTCLDVVF